VLAAARECPREREPGTPSFDIRFADVVPLSAGRILFGKPIEHDLAGGVLRVTLDRIYAYLALLPGAITEYQPDADKLVLCEHPAVSQRNLKRGAFNLDVSHHCLGDRR
jgi:hypothetical protein